MSIMTLETKINLKPETIAAVNDLVQANIDGAKGFDTVADATNDSFVEVRFAERADERRDNAAELSRLVQQSGEQPKHKGSWLAAFHRNWIGIKAASMSDNAKPLLSEIERGEQYLADRYESAIEECPASAVNDVLHRQLAGVKEVIRLVQAEMAKLEA